MAEQVFISSVQRELVAERRAVADFVRRDPALSRFFTVFLFEDFPAADRRPDELYLEEVDRSSIYIGILGKEYGSQNAAGVSPTEREFDRATAAGKPRLLFLIGPDDDSRHPRVRALVRRASSGLVWRQVSETPELVAAVHSSLVEHLERTGKLRLHRFDESACPGASMADISAEKVAWFLSTARRERQFALAQTSSPRKVLTHLNLLDAGQPDHAAILLFGREPQRFLLTSEIKCLHFRGAEVRKPIPAYQIFKGTVFDLVDQALEFVISRVRTDIGTRQDGPQALIEYALPRDAVAEAIVNAVTHRDYASNGSVQVMLFSDRLEVRNPGHLPPPLTPEKLRVPHASMPQNPLIAEGMFLARYVEKAGTGMLDMIARCIEADLPEPDMYQDGGEFVQTIWREWLGPSRLSGLGLNERQLKAAAAARQERRLTNQRYQELTGCSRATATRDLDDFVAKGLFVRVGRGHAVHYVVSSRSRPGGSVGSQGGRP